MRQNTRTTVLSAVIGVVLLVGLFSFAVLLPKADDSDAASSASGESPAAEPQGAIDLPDKLSNDMVAVDLGTLPAALTQQLGQVDDLEKQETAVSEGLARVFGVPGAFRVYAAPDASALANITVLDEAPGLFIPDALPIDPSVLGITRAASELIKVGDASCSVNWGTEVPAGQAVDPTVKPQGVRCQVGSGDRTFEITAQGLDVDGAVAVITALARS